MKAKAKKVNPTKVHFAAVLPHLTHETKGPIKVWPRNTVKL